MARYWDSEFAESHENWLAKESSMGPSRTQLFAPTLAVSIDSPQKTQYLLHIGFQPTMVPSTCISKHAYD